MISNSVIPPRPSAWRVVCRLRVIYYISLYFSSNQKKEWGSKLQQMISRDHKYIMITAEQLVGVCLFVFIRNTHAPYVR